MTWSIVGTTSAVTDTSGDITLTEPAGCQAGDVLVACIAYRDSAAFTEPANWTSINQQSSGNTSTTASTAIASAFMAYHERGANAPSLVFTRTGGDVAFGRVIALRSTKGRAVFDVAVGATLAANGTSVSSTGLTTSEDNEFLVMMGAGADNGTTSGYAAATDPTAGSWTERADSSTTSGADTTLAIATAEKATAGATGNLSYTQSTTSRHAIITAAFKERYALQSAHASYTTTGQSVPAGAGVNLVKLYESQHNIDGSGTDITIPDVELGAADVNRRIVVCINQFLNAGSGNTTQDAVSVGGVSLTQAAFAGGLTTSSIWSGLVPTGTSGTVVISPLGNTGTSWVTIFSCVNASITDSGSATGNASTTLNIAGWNAARFGVDILLGTGPQDNGGTTAQTPPADYQVEKNVAIINPNDAGTPNAHVGVYTKWHGEASSFTLSCGFTSGSGSTSSGSATAAIHLSGVNNVVVVAEQASYSTTGQNAGLLYKRILVAQNSVYATSAQAAELLRGLKLFADQVSYLTDAQTAEFIKSINLSADFASYSVTAGNAILTVNPKWTWTEEDNVGQAWVEGATGSATWVEADGAISTWTEKVSVSGSWGEQTGLSNNWVEEDQYIP